jgi:thioredoxin 1
MIELTKDNFEDLIEEGLTVVDFYSPTCNPCVRMKKILPNLELKLDGVANLYMVNASEEFELEEKYDVESVPTFIFFLDGKEVERFSGVKTLSEIEQITLRLKEKGYDETRTTEGREK